MKNGDTVTIKGVEYKISETLETGENTARQLGIVQQAVITGKRGATYLLQVFGSGEKRAISTTGRVITELP